MWRILYVQKKKVIIMSCPYIIRENIGFGRVREHGYYQFDEMVYDLTHGFVNADVEVFARTLYNVTMESGEELPQLDDDTVFKMLSAGLPVRYVKNARDGYITYSRPESKPVAKVKRSAVSLVQAQVVVLNSTMSLSFCPWRKSGLSLLVPTFLLALSELTMNSMQRSVSKEAFLVNGTINHSMTKSACITMELSLEQLFWGTKSFSEKGDPPGMKS